MKKRSKKCNKGKRSSLTPERLIWVAFIFACTFYCGTKIFLTSYNMSLATQDQILSQKVTKQEKKVEQLTSDVNTLQDKTRVLGILDDNVADNQKNVYIID